MPKEPKPNAACLRFIDRVIELEERLTREKAERLQREMLEQRTAETKESKAA